MDSRDEKPLFTRGRSLRFRPKSRVLTNSDSDNESGMNSSILHFLKNFEFLLEMPIFHLKIKTFKVRFPSL